MNPAKVRLSPKEKELVLDAAWILTKNGILEKVQQLLASTAAAQQVSLLAYSNVLPTAVVQSTPKISKGEKYQGLPYMILDYPRLFSSQETFAIRQLFWWGHFFSCTLHLSGEMTARFSEAIGSAYEFLSEREYYYCVHTDEWEHHFQEGNYQLIREIEREKFQDAIRTGSFIKLSKKYPLEQWDDIPECLSLCFEELLGVVTAQLPSR